MGSSVTTNTAKAQQEFMTNLLQANQEVCSVNQSVQADGNVLIFQNMHAGDNFTGLNVTSQGTDASCSMVSNMDSTIENILTASLTQIAQADSGIMGGWSKNTVKNNVNIVQTAVNNISQINQSLCTASETVSANNNYEYFSGTAGNNFVGVNVTAGTTTANCAMTNMMKQATYNQAQGSASQSASYKALIAAVAGTFAGIIGLIVIIVIVLFAVGAIGYGGVKVTGSAVDAAKNKNASTLNASTLNASTTALNTSTTAVNASTTTL